MENMNETTDQTRIQQPFLKIEKRPNNGQTETWVQFFPHEEAWQVEDYHWIGFDFDGVLSMPDPTKPYTLEELGLPVQAMVELAGLFIAAGITVKVFTARAGDAEMIPKIQDWTEQYGLGRLEVTNTKDYEMLRYYDDRAIQVVPPE